MSDLGAKVERRVEKVFEILRALGILTDIYVASGRPRVLFDSLLGEAFNEAMEALNYLSTIRQEIEALEVGPWAEGTMERAERDIRLAEAWLILKDDIAVRNETMADAYDTLNHHFAEGPRERAEREALKAESLRSNWMAVRDAIEEDCFVDRELAECAHHLDRHFGIGADGHPIGGY